MKKSDGICKLCNEMNETICHLLIECKCINSIWKATQKALCDITQENIVLSSQLIIFGMTNVQDFVSVFTNFLLYNTKWLIWKHRNCVRYGNEKVTNANLLFSQILVFNKEEAKNVLHSKLQTNVDNNLKGLMEKLASY